MPIKTQTQKERMIDHEGTDDGIPMNGRIVFETATPNNTPKSPPVTDIRIDSMRNCTLITKPVAPTAIRSPISYVRSVTLTSMMFMIPIPAMRREKPAAMPKMRVTVSIVDDIVCIISAWERMVKSSESPEVSFILWF